MCVCLVTQSCLTLCNPMDGSPPDFFPMGFSRQEYWSGLPLSLQGIFPAQGSNLGLLHCRQILYHLSHQGSHSRLQNQSQLCSAETQPSNHISVKVKLFSRVQLCDSMDCSPPGSSIHGIFQVRLLDRVAISFSRGSS